MRLTLLSAALLSAGVALAPMSAGAQDAEDPDVAEARAQFSRGRELAAAQRFSEAAEAFDRSLHLVARPSTAFNLALCYYALNRHVEAIALLDRFRATADPDEDAESLAETDRMLAHASASVARLVIDVEPVDASVFVDGQPLEGGGHRDQIVNPGPHVVRVEADHYAPVLIEVDAEPGQAVRRAVQLVSTRDAARIEVEVPSHPTAVIEVDGERVGVGSASLELDAGSHEVRIIRQDPSLDPWVRRLDIDWNERLLLNVSLADPQRGTTILDDGAFWGVGLGVVGAVAAGVLVGFLVAELQPEPSGGTTGVVLTPIPMNR